MDKLIFKSDDGGELELEIVEQTTIAGIDYILAIDKNKTLILKNISDKDDDVIYEIVNEEEINAVSKFF